MKTLPGFEVEARKWASGNISPCSLSIFTCVYVLMCICACTHMGVHTCIHWSPKITAIILHCSSTSSTRQGVLSKPRAHSLYELACFGNPLSPALQDWNYKEVTMPTCHLHEFLGTNTGPQAFPASILPPNHPQAWHLSFLQQSPKI